MIPMSLTVRDTTFATKLTLTDWLSICSDVISAQDDGTEELDQQKFERVIRRQGTTANAKRELTDELADLPKKPSKVSMRANLRANLMQELAALAAQQRAGAATPADADSSSNDDHSPEDDAAAAAMDAANAEEELV
jgi:hypothetical protein